MKNTILLDNKVVNLDTAKLNFMSNPLVSDKDANISLVDNYLKQLDWKVNENSNMSYSIHTFYQALPRLLTTVPDALLIPEQFR